MTTYCWREGNNPDGAWRIGSPVPIRCHNDNALAAIEMTRIGRVFKSNLMQHYHTGELELVPSDWIRPYPTEPIPQP